MFSLAKLAYMHTDQDERRKYYDYEVPVIESKNCCYALLDRAKERSRRDNADAVEDAGARTLINYSTICVLAIQNGHVECLKNAQAYGDPATENLCVKAAMVDDVVCLRYAFEAGCPRDVVLSIAAASSGHLECLRYAHENGCPWNELTCYRAARHSHLECLRYAHANGCPWSVGTLLKAFTAAADSPSI